MAFTDVTDGSRIIESGEGAVKITLSDAVQAGDLLGYNSGWVRADGNASVTAELIAGCAAASGQEITAYRKTTISGITTGTAGNVVYLSDTAGAYSVSAGTVSQVVGVELGSTRMLVSPQSALSSKSLIVGGALTAGTPMVAITATCSSTSGSTSAEAFYEKTTMTGIGGVGGRARFHMTTNVALAGWSNALKAYTEYGASGKTTGLGSAFCAEILLSAGTTSGTYAPLESELVADSAVSSGTATSFLYGDIGGSNSTGKTTLNTDGHLLELGAGVVDTTHGLFDAVTITPTAVEFDARLRIRIGGTAYFIPLSLDAAFE